VAALRPTRHGVADRDRHAHAIEHPDADPNEHADADRRARAAGGRRAGPRAVRAGAEDLRPGFEPNELVKLDFKLPDGLPGRIVTANTKTGPSGIFAKQMPVPESWQPGRYELHVTAGYGQASTSFQLSPPASGPDVEVIPQNVLCSALEFRAAASSGK